MASVPDPWILTGEAFSPGGRIVVSPAAGRMRRGPARLGDEIAVGAVLGWIDDGSRRAELVSAFDAVLSRWLVSDGQPVTPGAAIAWLEPRSSDRGSETP